MKRVSYFIDGFNLYHALRNLGDPKLKWLNLKSLCQVWTPKSYAIQDIFFFTAIPTWNQEKKKRHYMYINALESVDVKIIKGQFKKVTRKCLNNCEYSDKMYKTYEEKETDVNIAVYLLKEAVLNSYDQAGILSADSDLIPAIQAVRNLYPDKKFKSILPPSTGRNYKGKAIANEADSFMKIKTKLLHKHIFPRDIELKDGSKIYSPYF